MASNENSRIGATEVSLFLQNYAYSLAVTDMYNCRMMYLTDIDRIGYKGGDPNLNTGTLRKFVEDASGSSNIVENSILFTDSAGRATSSLNITRDGTEDRIISENGIDLGNNWTIETTPTSLSIKNNGVAIGFEFTL